MIAVHKELRLAASCAAVDGRQHKLIKDTGLFGLRQQLAAARLYKLLDGSRGLLAHPEQVVRGIMCSAWAAEGGKRGKIKKSLSTISRLINVKFVKGSVSAHTYKQ